MYLDVFWCILMYLDVFRILMGPNFGTRMVPWNSWRMDAHSPIRRIGFDPSLHLYMHLYAILRCNTPCKPMDDMDVSPLSWLATSRMLQILQLAICLVILTPQNHEPTLIALFSVVGTILQSVILFWLLLNDLYTVRTSDKNRKK